MKITRKPPLTRGFSFGVQHWHIHCDDFAGNNLLQQRPGLLQAIKQHAIRKKEFYYVYR